MFDVERREVELQLDARDRNNEIGRADTRMAPSVSAAQVSCPPGDDFV